MFQSRTALILFLATTCMNVQHGQCWSSTSTSSSTRNSITKNVESSRRDVLLSTAATFLVGTTATTTFLPSAANAVAPPTPTDLSRIQRGHARVQYLLQNWSSITESCNTGVMSDLERKQVVRTDGGGGGVCELNPLVVQEYLGYKSTLDPLFKVDKLMLKAAPLVDPDEFENYLSIVESYREKADNGSMMAYTSSWGEANPNGGKDIMEEYLEQTRDEVKQTEALLRQVMGYLNLEVLPPSKKM